MFHVLRDPVGFMGLLMAKMRSSGLRFERGEIGPERDDCVLIWVTLVFSHRYGALLFGAVRFSTGSDL